MTELNNNMTATEVVAAINGNLQECGSNESISLSDGAADVCSTLNEVFSGYDGVDELSATMSATEFVAAVNKDFGIAADGELEPLERFSFLHMSDSHGADSSINKAISMMTSGNSDYDDSIEFFLHTGDMGQSNNSSKEINAFDSNAAAMKMLFVQGNHDANEICREVLDRVSGNNGKNGKFILRYKAEGWMNNMNVAWGNTDEESVTIDGYPPKMSRGIYWSKDFILSDGKRKLSVIGLDLYNTGAGALAAYSHYITQKQANWFKSQLSTLGKNDYFLIALHEVPMYNNQERNDAPSTNATVLRRKNAFCSSRLWTFSPCSKGYEVFLTAIVDAYLNRENKTISVTYGEDTITVNAEFANKQPATFVAWLCGHVHGEILTHHPDYPNQLISSIDNCFSAHPNGQSSDLRYNSSGVPDDSGTSRPQNSVLINKLTIDFDNKELTIDRIGLKNTAHHTITTKSTGIDQVDSHTVGYEYDAVGNRIDGATYDSDGHLIRDTIIVPFAQEGGNEL